MFSRLTAGEILVSEENLAVLETRSDFAQVMNIAKI